MIKFCSPVIPDMDRVAFYLKESFEKKHLSNFGPAYQLLVQKLKEELELSEDRDILLTSSGHTALMAAYKAFDLTNLYVPSYTFKSTQCAATMQGMYVQLVDVNTKTGCMDELPNRPWKAPDGVVSVCALSTIPDFKAIKEQTSKIKAKLIIDGAATFGTPGIYNEGDAFCLSMHATKTFPIGECGALIAKKDVIETAKRFINFGFNSDRVPTMEGMNAKISEYTCAIGLALLEKMDAAIEARLTNSNIYHDELGDLIPTSASPYTVYQAMPLSFTFDHEKARRVRSKLKEAGVEILQYYRPLDYAKNTEMLYACNVCLPCHQDLTAQDVNYLCGLVKSV